MPRHIIQLLRIPFSLFLLPVFLFALSQVHGIDPLRAVLVFFIWHGLVYPASNGYNSYMDRDTGPIGGIKAPPPPPPRLFAVTVGMDIAALLLSVYVSPVFAACSFVYVMASRAYSYRGVRLKRYPWAGYFTVVCCQGALVFFATWYGCGSNHSFPVPVLPMCASSLLIGGFYPLTQIYQHDQDTRDGVRTLSYVLGYSGTFIFCAVIYAAGFAILALYFQQLQEVRKFLYIQIYFLPVIIYFIHWFTQVRKNPGKADHTHTMRMNWLASSAANAAFGTLLIWSHSE